MSARRLFLAVPAIVLLCQPAIGWTCKDARKLSPAKRDIIVRQYQIPCEAQLQIARACRIKVPLGYCR